MTIDLVEMIRSQAECSENISFRESYSGRAMYGKNCIGVVGSVGDITQMISEIASELMTNVFDNAISADPNGESDQSDAAYDYHDDAQQALTELLEYCQDDMGRSSIVYWTKLSTDKKVD